MPSMTEAWDVVKPILEVGAVGGMLLIMIRFFREASKDRTECLEQRVTDEKAHSKEMMRLQTAHNKELASLARHYDQTLVGVNLTLEKLSERFGGS